MRPYVLSETDWQTVQSTDYAVAVLPWGATEAHNFHLPYGTDNYESEYVAIEAARRAWERGTKTVVLPGIPYGVNTGQLDIRLCLNMNPSTQFALLNDLLDSLYRQGMRRFVIVNGHGGNDFKQFIRELQPRYPEMFLGTLNWYQAANARAVFDEPGDHAGELETSVMLKVVPDLVRPLSEAGDGAARRSRLTALREGWAWTPRAWTKVSRDTGVGNPVAATPQKGEQFLELICENVAVFLEELAAADPADHYE